MGNLVYPEIQLVRVISKVVSCQKESGQLSVVSCQKSTDHCSLTTDHLCSLTTDHFSIYSLIPAALCLLHIAFCIVSLSFAQENSFSLPQAQHESGVLSANSIFVQRFKFYGNTIFYDEALEKVSSPYENKNITFEMLEKLRHELTVYYVERGYINSGAIIPDQRIKDNEIVFWIIEGRISDIEITGNKRLREEYIRSRLCTNTFLNINDLQEKVQLLDQNPLIRRINAEISPAIRLGESVLTVQVEEERPFHIGVKFCNDRSPSIGGERAEVSLSNENLTGWGDTIGISYGLTQGLDDISAYYILPLTAQETTLKLRYDRSDSSVIEEPFDDIDIESRSVTYGITLSHPVFRTPAQELILSITGERRHSETFLLGTPQSFSVGASDGESDVTVIRFTHDWTSRKLNQIIAARSVISVGIGAFGATRNQNLPDGRFFVWLGQFQFARQMEQLKKSQVIFRTDIQLSADPLLSLEKFSVGGSNSVRGYRENRLVRDNGIVSSLEVRIPIFRLGIPGLSKKPEDGIVYAAPFIDWGWAENTDFETPDPRTISGAGLGIRWDPTPDIHAQAYWGHALRNISNTDTDIQDSGIHFQLDCHW